MIGMMTLVEELKEEGRTKTQKVVYSSQTTASVTSNACEATTSSRNNCIYITDQILSPLLRTKRKRYRNRNNHRHERSVVKCNKEIPASRVDRINKCYPVATSFLKAQLVRQELWELAQPVGHLVCL